MTSTLQEIPRISETIDFPAEELKILSLWKELAAFRTCLEQSKGKPRYSFYDGPPFATGLPHYGHILAGTVKDIVTRYAHQRGFHVERRFGWDCHGLPVEYEIDKNLGIKGPEDVQRMGIDQYNNECRKIVTRYVKEWKLTMNRIGRWIDFDHDYKTLYPWFMESVWWVFKQLFLKGLVYQGNKIMPYSTACRTPLSNFESGQNYRDVTDPAVTVSLPIIGDEDGAAMLIWTTTPWTLPSNLAACVNAKLIYARIKETSTGKIYVLLKSRIEFVCKDCEILEEFLGEKLKNLEYEPIFSYYAHMSTKGAFRVLTDDYVTAESGTGIVHQAPYFGEDDYRVCLAAVIITRDQEPICPIDVNGLLTKPIVDFEGQYFKDADKNIIAALKQKNRLVRISQVQHSYPFCWRSDTPLIYKAIPSWFIRVQHMSELLQRCSSETFWVPEFVKDKRFSNWLKEARDWAVSRNRYWGTPIPIWSSPSGDEICCVGSIAELEELTVLTVTTDLEDNFEEYYDDDYDDSADLNFTTNGTLQFVRELSNITRRSGKTVKLLCEVKNTDTNGTNAKIRFIWKKDNAFIDESRDKRVTIKPIEKSEIQVYGSQLRIAKVDLFDRGFYDCIASNGIDRIQSQGVLEIINEKWGNAASDLPTFKPVFEGVQSHNMEGDHTTFFPHMERKSREEIVSTITNPILPTLSEQTIKNPALFDKTAEDLPHVNTISAYNFSQPFCQLYTGNTCKNYLENRYVFVQPPYNQTNIEAKLENAVLVVTQSNEISTSCSKFALPSLCFSAFPICVDSEQINTYRKDFINKYKIEQDPKIFKNIRNKLSMLLQRICKEDCEFLEKELCKREYAIAKRHPVISQPLELDECQFLPDETDKSSMYCLSLGLEQIQNVNQDDVCFWDYGDLYRGIHDISISGKKCIRWSHQYKIDLSEYPELSGHSYCRNPGGQEQEPFCYIEQNKKEICGLPKCANVIWLYLLTAVIAIILVASFISALVLYCYKRRKNQKSRLQNMNVPTADKNIYGNTGPNSPMELNTLLPTRITNMPPRSHSSHRNGFQSVPHYTYKEVAFVEELGEGAFGKVYKGDLKSKSGKIVVAVKSLKENASAKTQADFQREIELISELKHPNIICLLGVVIKQEPMCMLFEYMSEGDLHEFLIVNSPNEGKCLSQQQFLHIALQIAQGMEYLSENHYVHRDLAARNCLVSKDLVVKISDFGLSRDMYSCDYYRVQSKSLLPVRWMPPESILYGKFTTESDVWSYGVVLWEIYSYGLQPYYGYNNQEVISMIRSRKLLPCPDSCPSYCYVLMVECWAELAIRRPNFTEIVHRLKVWKQNGSSSGAYFKNPEVHTIQQKHGSKSSHTSDSPTVCPSLDNQSDPPHTWEKNLRKTSVNKLNESQSSLTSHTSSLGNRTQSTSLSNDHNVRNSRKSIDRKGQKSTKNDNFADGLNPKNTVVSSNGDSFETKLTF